MADLRFIDEAGHLCVVRLAGEPVLIGRTNTCQIMFADDLISREHARFESDAEGRCRVRDLGSRNKTYVNGQQVTEVVLTHGDVIRVGGHVVEFLDEGSPRERLNLEFLTPDRSEPAGSEWVKIKAPVTLSLEQVAKLAGCGSFLGATARIEEIAELALGRLLLDLQADRGFIARRGDKKGDIVPIAHRGLTLSPGGSRMPVSQAFVSAAVLQSVAGRYPREASQINAKTGYAATGMVAPLLHRNEIIGVLYVDRPVASQPFSAMALQHVAAAGSAVGGIMAEATKRLSETIGPAEAAWLSAARRIQVGATAAPQPPSPFAVAFKQQRGSLRCGDLHDVIPLGEGKCVLTMLDAGGSGVAGLAQALAIRAGIRCALSVRDDPMDLAPALDALNRGLAGQPDRQLVTTVVVGVDLSIGRVAYINAGGLPPLLLMGAGRLITLDQPSLVLGVDAQYAYEANSVDLPADFRIVCHTDGLVNAANATGEAFGESRLHELLLDRDAFQEPGAVIERILGALHTYTGGHAPDDDGTILVLAKG